MNRVTQARQRRQRELETGPERIYVPPGWPQEVRPPGAPDWEATAVGFLLDCCPADYRGYPVLRRHPLVLAQFAKEFVEGQCESSRTGLAGVRRSLAGLVPPHAVEQAAEAWQEQQAHLLRVRRGVALVEEALRGQEFVRKL